jgi:hypothetical protein
MASLQRPRVRRVTEDESLTPGRLHGVQAASGIGAEGQGSLRSNLQGLSPHLAASA